MDISASYTMDGTQASAAADGLRKLERMRVTPAFVVLIAGIALGQILNADPTVTMVCDAVFAILLLVLAVLTVRWLRIAAHVRKAAPAFTRPTAVSITDQGLTVSRAGAVTAKAGWKDIAHVTNTANTWIFALKGGQEAALIPQQQLTPADREQLSKFLATWPKRRYRTTPW